MGRLFWLIILLAFSVSVSAQMQQGVVKTRGRMVNGVLQMGKGLDGATVQIAGRQAVVSKGNDGNFSFPVSGQKYRIEKVQKQGYQLVDYSVCTEYKYSENPLRLVMDTPEQQLNDQLTIERKIRRNLQRQLQQKEDKIEALQVSQQEKDSMLRILYQQQTDNEKLIADMAKRYSTLDYDQLDEFYRRVSWFIENGELLRADSILRTRGDIHTQVQDIIKQGAVIKEQKEQIQKAESVHQADVEEAAYRCYSYYETFFARHLNDSAAYYLELRALLDTTNVDWTNEAGLFVDKYLADLSKALKYFQRMLRQSLMQFGEQNKWTSAAYNCIGHIYCRQGNYPKALEYYNMALTIGEEVLGMENSDVALSYNNIGYVYSCMGNYTMALEYYTKVLAIYEKVYKAVHPDVATSHNNTGYVYFMLGNNSKALEYYTKALNTFEKVYGVEHPDVATTISNIGLVYFGQGDIHLALEYYTKALNIRKKVLGMNHPDIATSYNNIGGAYGSQGDYVKALEYYIKALNIREKVLGTEHPDVALSYNNIGSAYYSQRDYDKALEYYTKAFDIREKVLGVDHPSTKKTWNNIELVKSILSQDAVTMQGYMFIATIDNGDTPAYQQGMSGEYVVLEFTGWAVNEVKSLFDIIDETRGKPKYIVVMKDDAIKEYHFENRIGAHIDLKKVGKEEKLRIIKKYERWKSDNKY